MFTSGDISKTKEWISGIVGREVPVASIDALATWDKTIIELPSFKNEITIFSFYNGLRKPEVRAKVVAELRAALSK